MLRMVLTSIIAYFVSQLICVGKFRIFPKKKGMLFYNFLTIFCLYSFISIFITEERIVFLSVILLTYILSLIMYYVHEFRGTNINLSDILSINTAKEVAGGYKYDVSIAIVFGFILVALEFLYQIRYLLINNFNFFSHRTNLENYILFWYKIREIALFFISFFLLKDKISQRKYDYSLNAGENEGYIYNFISSIPIFHRQNNYKYDIDESNDEILKNVDEGSKEFLKNLFTKSAQDFANIKSRVRINSLKNNDLPHVIVIMNESFGSAHWRIKANKVVTPYYDSLSGVTKGNLYVNTFGGGTANTEFEFLTGMTVGNYPYPVMPYNNFVRQNKYSLATYFNSLGYNTIAMHPYTATNYHRNKVYKRFGFNQLVFLNDFRHKSYIRNYVSDSSMYEELIRRFEARSSATQKLFIFGITMQNHSGYSIFKEASVLSLMTNYKKREAVDSYLSLMKLSDDALKTLIEYFASIDEHVVILFFGDHNASFGTEINKMVYGNGIEYECTNAYATPFFIYDNKTKNNEFIEEISANFLSIELLKKAKLPLDPIHEIINEIYKKYSVYNYHKAKNRKDKKLYDIPNDIYMRIEREYLK